MGTGHETKCNDCHNEFEVRFGDCIDAEMLRCWRCGHTIWITYETMGLFTLRLWATANRRDYAHGLWQFPELEKIAETNPELPLLSHAGYRRALQRRAGRCKCGGPYRVTAPARCPRCRSTSLTFGEVCCYYW